MNASGANSIGGSVWGFLHLPKRRDSENNPSDNVFLCQETCTISRCNDYVASEISVGPLRIAPHTFRNSFIELADFVSVMGPGPLLHDLLLLWLLSEVAC